MKRHLIVAVALLATAAAGPGCGGSDEDDTAATATATTAASSACPSSGTRNGAVSTKFEGTVTMDQRKHVVSVTRDGRPVEGASVCVNAAMVGMTSMHYTAEGREVEPGRYEVPIEFEMEGTYKGNVVTRESGRQTSTPVSVEVGKGGGSSTTGHTETEEESMESMEEDSKTTGGAMSDGN